MYVIHPVLLFSAVTEPQPYREPLERVLRDCELWLEAQGIYALLASVKCLYGHAIDTDQENPWYQVREHIAQQGYPSDHLVLVFLAGWDDPQWAGWGGPPLAVVGDWALRALASIGSPDAIIDDRLAGNLCLHEIGHALGLPHRFDVPCDIMSYDWCGYNSLLTDRPAADVALVPTIIPAACAWGRWIA